MSEIQFFKEKPKERVHIWVCGKGKEISINIRYFDDNSYVYADNGTIYLIIKEAKELYQILGEAIEKAEKKALVKEEEDDS